MASLAVPVALPGRRDGFARVRDQALGWDVPALITDADRALTAIVVADTWQWFPFTMLMILATLQTVRFVTLPWLEGVLLVAAPFRLIDSIEAFPLIFILIEGGSGSLTEATNYYSYIQAFNFSFLGYSWAIIRLVGWGQARE